MIKIKAHSLQETYALATILAEIAETGDVITLSGKLGSGKSEFARAFIQAAVDRKTVVPSPTFTILQEYEGEKYWISHFDLYRVDRLDEVIELGLEESLMNGVTLIEWPEKLGDYPLDNLLQITIVVDEETQERWFYLDPDESWQEHILSLEEAL